MVDAIVSYVIQKLEDLLLQEAKFLGEVEDEVRWLQRELKLLQCYIKDAEGKQGDFEPIRQWVSHIREIAYDVEDVLNLFVLKTAGSRKKGFLSSIKHQFKKHKIGKEIKSLKQRITDLSRQRECYDLRRLPDRTGGQISVSNMPIHLRRTNSFAVEKDFVGFEDDIKILLDQLMNGKSDRHVISIFGTGGLGKTTLARKLYHHNEVRRNFACCAWVCVSQDYKGRELLLNIIRSFKINTVPAKELELMGPVDLERHIYEYLERRSYLVVIDDVWEEDAWGSLRRAFPDNNTSSRVIITTRKKNVANCYFERTHVHELQFLTEEDSWKLFGKKAFWKLQRDEELDKLGKEMVTKCRGLPLAIVVLGGLLSTKNFEEWKKVRRNIWQNLENGSIEIKCLLSLSFDDLPSELKLFFLYLSHFPEDFEIRVEDLIRKVVAEGLVVERQGEIMEDIAKDNIHELINRSLIQIGKRCWGRIVTCRLHDLLRDLTARKAEELNFISICDERSSLVVSSCRRHAIYSADDPSLWLHKSNPRSRSLVFFTQTKAINDICKNFTLLRLFDVRAANFEYPNEAKEVGNLILLKYLRLIGEWPEKLPSSFGNLQRLQTLDVDRGKKIKLPAKAYEMKDLRHLIGYFEGDLSFNNLTELQTLNRIRYESWIKLDHEKFVNLRELHIIVERDEDEDKMIRLESISKLISLRILSISSSSHYTLSSLQPLFYCQDLKELRIHGVKIDELPEDMDILLPNLECLSLSSSHLKHDPMPTLEKLPNLRFLDLGGGFNNVHEKMLCNANGFPRLEVLVLESIRLKELQVEDGAMPVLQGLRIVVPNDELVIPERLRSVPLPVEQSYFHDIEMAYYE